jgi:hypothetical protein
LQKEQALHAAARSSVREYQRETVTLKGKLDGKDAEMDRTNSEVQRCHVELAERDVEIHQMRMQLQAREAELGQMRAQRRMQSQASDATLQRQRFELGEREQALNDRDRLLNEREQLAVDLEVLLSKQKRELMAERQRANLAGLRTSMAELAVPLAGAQPIVESRRQPIPNSPAVTESPAVSSAACRHRNKQEQFTETPGDAGDIQTPHKFGRLELADLCGKPVKELAEILRLRRHELRSEHSQLEEDRRQWRNEIKQSRKAGYPGQADALPEQFVEARATLDSRAASLNSIMNEHRALEQLLRQQHTNLPAGKIISPTASSRAQSAPVFPRGDKSAEHLAGVGSIRRSSVSSRHQRAPAAGGA